MSRVFMVRPEGELQQAAFGGNVEAVNALLAEIPVDTKDVQGRTALHHAASQGHVDCVKVVRCARGFC
jgi:ankyrin repeat protein